MLISRRQLLTSSAIGLASSMFGLACVRRADSFPCDLTPEQTEGPFYPVDRQLDEDNDLTVVSGKPGRAEGQIIYIRGQILDGHCRPVQGTTVDDRSGYCALRKPSLGETVSCLVGQG